MKKCKIKYKFSVPRLLKWLGADPYKEALLISEVPVRASTLGRIKSGSYIPSERLGKAITVVMERRDA